MVTRSLRTKNIISHSDAESLNKKEFIYVFLFSYPSCSSCPSWFIENLGMMVTSYETIKLWESLGIPGGLPEVN